MIINLKKGEKVELDQKKLTLSLGWDSNNDADIDSSVFLLNEQKMLPNESNFIYYNNLQSPCGGVIHSGDNTDGNVNKKELSGNDKEVITIDLSKLNPNIVELLIVVSVHNNTDKSFGSVNNSYVRIVDDSDKREIAKYVLDEKFSIEKSVEFGRLYKIADKWKFSAVGAGYDEDLSYFVEKHYSGTVVK